VISLSQTISNKGDQPTHKSGNSCRNSSSTQHFEALSLQRISRRISTSEVRPWAFGKPLGRPGRVTKRRNANRLLADPKSGAALLATSADATSSSQTKKKPRREPGQRVHRRDFSAAQAVGQAAPTMRVTHARTFSTWSKNRPISLAHFDSPLVELIS